MDNELLESTNRSDKSDFLRTSEYITDETCMACGDDKVYVYKSTKYTGYRGICITCKNNWPES